MFGKKNDRPRLQTIFGAGAQGGAATVFNTSSSMFTVSGSGNHDGTYFRSGNLISGPDGMHTVIGSGPVRTVLGPNGETRTVIEHGFGGTVF